MGLCFERLLVVLGEGEELMDVQVSFSGHCFACASLSASRALPKHVQVSVFGQGPLELPSPFPLCAFAMVVWTHFGLLMMDVQAMLDAKIAELQQDLQRANR